jgi:predicted PurR-regulated permease PerM
MTALSQLISTALFSLVLAIYAWFADRRLLRRRDLERVSLVPWVTVFFLALIAAILIGGLAIREWFAG